MTAEALKVLASVTVMLAGCPLGARLRTMALARTF